MADKPVNADKVSDLLKQSQRDLENFGNEEYQQRQEENKKRQQQFGQFFGKFSRQKTQRGVKRG